MLSDRLAPPAGEPPMIAKKVVRASLCVLILALALAGCGDGEIPSVNQTTTTITGTVIAPAGDSQQFVAVAPGGVFSQIAAFVLGDVHADITGLAPVAGATVELVRLSDDSVVDTAVTNENGVYTFTGAPAIGQSSEYAVRVSGEPDVMRAIVTGALVDISPATEVVTEAVLDSLIGSVVLGNYHVQEVAALYGVLASMDIDVTGQTFSDAVQTIGNAAGPIFQDMLVTFSTPGIATVLRGGDFSIVDFSAALRDPLIVPAEGLPGGVEIDSGQGPMIFGNRDQPSPGLVAIGKFLHDFGAVAPLYPEDEPVEDAYPHLVGLDRLVHVVNDKRQLVVADTSRPSFSVAGVGATTASGSLLIYPVDYTVRVDDAPSISGMGIRYASRWRLAGFGQTLPGLSLLDADGGGATTYHEVRMQQVLAAEGGGDSAVTLMSSTGTVNFDSTPQLHDFDGQPRDYGALDTDAVTNSLRLDLSDYSISASVGADQRSSLYYVLQSTGLVQFRSETGTVLGWGSTSTDGERDGEVIGINTFSGGFDEPVTSTERTFAIGIRQASEMANADLTGNYNVVEYSGYLSEDAAASPPRAFVHSGIRYGSVILDGDGGISSGTIFGKRATLDVAAARGETGAEPSFSGESGSFTTGTAGDAGETFSLTVDGVEVFSFTSAAAGDTVEAADIQAGLDGAASQLLDAGIEYTGSVIDGDLIFSQPSGEDFDIVVVNEFSGVASAAGGFEGDDFQPGINTIDNASPAVPNASGASGAFTTAYAGDGGEEFTLEVGGVPVFTFTSTAIGDDVTAADVQGGVDASIAALEAVDIEVSGTVAGGDLVFTQTEGLPFTILVTNTFTGVDGAAGGFAGADFQTGTNTVTGGTEAEDAVVNSSGASGTFTTAYAGAADEILALEVDGIELFRFESDNIGDTVEAADIQAGIDLSVAELAANNIEVSGTVAGGDLVFTQTEGVVFTIQVTNTFTGVDGAAGGFAGADFQTGTNTIANGTVATPSISGASGAFTTAYAGASGETFALQVGTTTLFTFTSSAAGDAVEAADVQGGIDTNEATLNGEGITISGTVAGGDLVFTRTDGTAFTIQVTNTFTGVDGAEGGFANFQSGTTTVTGGTEAQNAEPNASGASGTFSPAISGDAGETFALTVDGIPVYSVTSGAAEETVEAADVQGGIDAAEATLNAAGIDVSGTVAGGDLIFTRADGVAFDIVVTNEFSGTPGGFAGADFAPGTNTIDNGAEAVEAVATTSQASGAFATAVATEVGQTYTLTVGGVGLVSITSATIGQSVSAADIQAQIVTNEGALNAAGIEFSGSAETGDLVFTKADGTDFDIVIVNDFSGDALTAGGFAGADFAPGAPQEIANGVVADPTESAASGVFATAIATEVGQTYSLTVGGVELYAFTSSIAGETVTAADVQGGINANAAALSAAGIEFSGSADTGDLVFTKADGSDFDIVIANTFSDAQQTAGGFASADFAPNAPQEIDNGAEAIEAVATTSQASGAFTTAVATEVGQTYSLTVGGVGLVSITSAAIGESVTAADIQAQIVTNEGALNAAGIEFSGSAETGDLVFTKADGSDFDIVIVNTFSGEALTAGGFAGEDFAANSVNDIDNGEAIGLNASAPSGDFEAGTSGAADETWSLTVGGVTVYTFTSTDADQTVTAEDVQAGIDASAAELDAVGITASGTVSAGDLVFTREDGAPFDIVVVNEFTGTVSIAGGFAGDDFATGIQTVDNGTLAGPAPSLSSQSGQQPVSFGSYDVLANGGVTLILSIGGETITAQGAVTQDGEFIALATGTSNGDNSVQGRGILFLVRQPN